VGAYEAFLDFGFNKSKNSDFTSGSTAGVPLFLP